MISRTNETIPKRNTTAYSRATGRHDRPPRLAEHLLTVLESLHPTEFRPISPAWHQRAIYLVRLRHADCRAEGFRRRARAFAAWPGYPVTLPRWRALASPPDAPRAQLAWLVVRGWLDRGPPQCLEARFAAARELFAGRITLRDYRRTPEHVILDPSKKYSWDPTLCRFEEIC